MIKRTTKGRSKKQRARNAKRSYAKRVVEYGQLQKRLKPLSRRRANIIKRMQRDTVIEANRALRMAQAENAKLIAIANDNVCTG